MGSQSPDKAKIAMALIVEDDPGLRELGAVLLEETDLEVVECADAEQAMAVMARDGDNVALVFADVRLPGPHDGIDLARRVKALWPHVSMIVTSGYAARRPEKLPDSVTYMPKPWVALEVLKEAERAAAWMRRGRRAVG